MRDERRLEAAAAALPEEEPRPLVMDEFALSKAHRYANVVLDADTRRVLWVCEGRSRAAARPFFEALGLQRCARIEAVAMDMNTGFALQVRHHCPNARWFMTCSTSSPNTAEVIGRVSVDAASQLRHDKPARCVVKQAHWLLLRNPVSVTAPAQKVSLDECSPQKSPSMTLYVMKEQLGLL